MTGPVTAEEVLQWFGNHHPRPTVEQCAELAFHFDRMRRIKNKEPVEWIGPPGSKMEETEYDDSESPFWDIDKVRSAYTAIIAELPKIKAMATVERPEVLEHILCLEQSVQATWDFIDCPAGRFASERRRQRPKDWHIAAISIAHKVAQARLLAGANRVSYEKDSAAVRIITAALVRIGYLQPGFDKSAVSQYLKRFFAWAGEPVITTR